MADTKPQISVHPVLSNLQGQPPDSPVELSGYVGPASGDGKIRLYHSLQDLTHYIEFDANSVVHTAPASSDIAPNNGLTLWVKSDTPIRWSCEYKTAQDLFDKVSSTPSMQPPGVSYYISPT